MSGLKKPKNTPRPARPKWARKAGHDLTLPAAFLTELRRGVGETAPQRGYSADFLEAAALAFRRSKRHGVEILLISKRRAHNWGIPKGKLVPYLSFAENAAKEAFEEAGVVGRITPDAVGVYRARKTAENRLRPLVIEVWVYLLEVTGISWKWPEKDKRLTRWVSCETAALLLREPMLANLCQRLAQV